VKCGYTQSFPNDQRHQNSPSTTWLLRTLPSSGIKAPKCPPRCTATSHNVQPDIDGTCARQNALQWHPPWSLCGLAVLEGTRRHAEQ
jgi:hypothetical protein